MEKSSVQDDKIEIIETSIEQDANEFGLHIRQGGWRMGLLVARNVQPGTGGPRPERTAQTCAVRKISARQFADIAGNIAPNTVTKHLNAWNRAAEAGYVLFADNLSPGDEIDLDNEKLPSWKSFFSPKQNGTNSSAHSKSIDSVVESDFIDIIANTETKDLTERELCYDTATQLLETMFDLHNDYEPEVVSQIMEPERINDLILKLEMTYRALGTYINSLKGIK